MSDFNIAEKSKNNQDKVDVDLAASGVAYKECLNMSSSLENIIVLFVKKFSLLFYALLVSNVAFATEYSGETKPARISCPMPYYPASAHTRC
ncbi:hypothetical protein DMH17_11000 [Raoultella planticola]|nr:hypothetical protein [Raoultella planticola]